MQNDPLTALAPPAVVSYSIINQQNVSWEGPRRALEATGVDFGCQLGRRRHFASKRHRGRQVFVFFRHYCFYRIVN